MDIKTEKLKPWILPSICVVTLLCFINTLHNQFTNWDDDTYVALNPYIKAFTWDNLKVIFTKNITINYYHPFTLLTFALNYHFSQMSPNMYYLTNILLHISNTVLVFFLAQTLFSRVNFIDKKGVLFISSLSALWFGIHPMHVESVSWIAERKDVLYTFFYLLGLISYILYLTENSWRWYAAIILLFISSCLSKPMAVVFPLSLFCIDFLLQRKWKSRIILEKLPFIFISVFFGMLAFHFAHESNTITPFENIPIGKRILFASYGFVMYVSKFFYPVHLSTFYPYPCVNMELHVDMSLPLFYYLSLWIGLIILIVPLYFTYKKNRNYFAVVVFGLGFFIANIIFELQFISSGMTIMADRYSYVSYIGLIFATTFFLHELIKRFPAYKISILVFVVGVTATFAWLCHKRTEVWLTGENVFKDAVEQYGDEASLFYKALGDYYTDKKMTVPAIEYFAKYARLNNDAEVLNDLGNLYKSQKDYPHAAKYYLRLIHAGAPLNATYLKVSDAWATMGMTDSALVYYQKAAALNNPQTEKLFSDIGTACINIKQFDNAINHYNVLIEAYPQNPYYYFYRGVAKFSKGQLNESIDDFMMPLKLNPNEVSKISAYNLSVVYDQLGKHDEAYKYAVIARQQGQVIDSAFFNKLKNGAFRLR